MLQKKILNILIIIEIIVLLFVFVYGTLTKDTSFSGAKNTDKSNQESEVEPDQETITDTEPVLEVFDLEVQNKINDMTIEEKVAQIFIITPEALADVDRVIRAGDTSKASYDLFPVGGLVYAKQNITGTSQAEELVVGFREISLARIGLDLLSVIEEEGGEDTSPVSRLEMYDVEPSAAEIGETGDVARASESAKNIALGISAIGINANLAPVTDMTSESDIPYNERTFGSDSELLSQIVAAQITAFQENGVFSSMKYFPGKSYGVSVESTNIPVNNRTLEELQLNEFKIYQRGINSGVKMIMLANVISQSITGNTNTPCSLSQSTVKVLREQLGFKGIIITDNLSEESITGNYSSEEAAIMAIQAGVDVIYKPADFKKAYQAIIDGVKSGEINETLINNAVGHILTVKMNK